MAKVISRESVSIANHKCVRGNVGSLDMDSHNISMRFKTSFGAKDIVVSKSRILSAASNALKEISKK